MAKSSIKNNSKVTKKSPPKKGILSVVADVMKNSDKYFKEPDWKPYVSKDKPTKTFVVSDPKTYKERAKRYNDSLSLYKEGQNQRAQAKKNVLKALENYKKNKAWFEPDVEYAGEGASDDERTTTTHQKVKYGKSANTLNKIIGSPYRALGYDKNGNYSPKIRWSWQKPNPLVGSVNTDAIAYPKPEYKPVFQPKKTTTKSLPSNKKITKKLTKEIRQVNNPSVKKTDEVKPIITNDPKDPRLKNYNDSLTAYKKTKYFADNLNEHAVTKNPNSFKNKGRFYDEYAKSPETKKFKPYKAIGNGDTKEFPLYKKPVQPVIYKKSTPTKTVSKDTVSSKPTVKTTVKPIAKDTVASKPVSKPTTAPVNKTTKKPAIKKPVITSYANFGDTGTFDRGSYIEVKKRADQNPHLKKNKKS